MSKLATLIADYLAAPRTLRQAVAGLTREQQLARPVAGKMSTLEVVVHIADFEPIFAERMKRILTYDRPAILAADENLFLEKLAYHERDIDEELAIVEHTRSQMARILRTRGDEVLARVGVHSERGERTLEQFLSGATGHITHHVAFIHEKRKALGV